MYKIITLINLFFLLTVKILFAQTPDTLWTKVFGGPLNEKGSCVIQTPDGGFAIVGFTYSYSIGMNDWWLLKTDSLGNLLWNKTYGGSNAEWASEIVQTADSCYIIVGSSQSFGSGGWDARLLKVNSTGDTLWTKTYGGPLNDFARAICIKNDHGYLIAGHGSSGTSGAWLINTDSLGNEIWSIKFGVTNDEAYSVQNTFGGRIIVTGSKGGHLWLCQISLTGEILWSKTFIKDYFECGYSVQQTHDGGFIAAGCTLDQNFIGDFYIVRTNALGDTLWTTTYDGGSDDRAECIKETGDNGFIVAGYTYNYPQGYDFCIIKIDSLGRLQWSKNIGGGNDDFADYITILSDGDYIITGQTQSFGSGGSDLWLVKLNSDTVVSQLSKIKKFIPTNIILFQNYPNPFNPSTTIAFDLPKTSQVTLKVFNILGEEVTTLVSDRLPAGSYSYEWDASNLASGVYLYRLQAGEYVQTCKMILMK